MTQRSDHLHVAVLGAGIAGSAVARGLEQAGHRVQVFDRSAGPGGRLATRRAGWVDGRGELRTTCFDHGAPGFTAASASFRQFVQLAVQAGLLAEWAPRAAAAGLPLLPAETAAGWFVPVPDMPSLCRRLLSGSATRWACEVDGLHHGPSRWQVQGQGRQIADGFDAVVLALPPARAAPLLGPHRPDWARQASLALMKPCWALIGVAEADAPALAWDVARPEFGPLAWVARNESRPGRERRCGEVHWVAHARSGWSRAHLEQPAAWVQERLQQALAEWLGGEPRWMYAQAHRWRYALPGASASPHAAVAAASGQYWWDSALGLGACGDFLGGTGVEGAWLSAQSLVQALTGSTGCIDLPSPAWQPTTLHRPAARTVAA